MYQIYALLGLMATATLDEYAQADCVRLLYHQLSNLDFSHRCYCQHRVPFMK